MRSISAALAVGGALVLAPPAVRADEPVTGFVYTTDLLPEGKYEVEQWMTWRAHKAVGVYNVIEARSEFEYGVTDAFQLSGYINYEWAEAYHNNVMDGTTLPPESFAQLDVGPDENFHTTRFTGVALEGIYRILSPYTDPIGLAVLIEPTVGPSLRELESRVIVQKNYFDDRLILAFNLTVSQEVRRVPGDPSAPAGSDDFQKHWDKETDMNFGLAASYRFAPNWSFGLELQHEREWAGLNPFDGDKATNAAFYFGPTIHYGGEHFFATLTVLDQLPWAKDDANQEPDFVVDGRNYADDFERFRVRAKLGWYF